MTDKEFSKTFCVYPWVSLMSNTTGSINYCCIAKPGHLRNENGNFLHARDGLKAAWNSDNMKEIRQAMIEGKQISGCETCYMQEKISGESFRTRHNQEWIHKLGLDHIKKRVYDSKENGFHVDLPPVYLDLRLGNLCNLKCRMCNVFNSSMIAKEHFELEDDKKYNDIFRKTYGNNPDWLRDEDAHSWADGNLYWSEIVDFIPHLQKVYMTGGEPTLIQNNFRFMQECISQEKADQIHLFFNTNCTNVNDKFIELISQFGRVDINASIDGYGPVNEYIRAPSKWKFIDRNFRRIAKLKNVNLNVTPVLQIYNSLYMDQLCDWVSDVSANDRNSFDIGIDFLINEHPRYLDVLIMPEEIRETAWMKLNAVRERGSAIMNHGLTRGSMENALGYLAKEQTQDWREQLEEFWHMTNTWDQKRNQNIETSLPELAMALKEIK